MPTRNGWKIIETIKIYKTKRGIIMTTYSPFSVRDAVKDSCPEMVETIYGHAPFSAKEAFDEIYDRWQRVYDNGDLWFDSIAFVPSPTKRFPCSDKSAQEAITKECDKEIFAMYLHVMLMEMPSDLFQNTVEAVSILGGSDMARIHIAGHDITVQGLADAYNEANPKKNKICV